MLSITEFSWLFVASESSNKATRGKAIRLWIITTLRTSASFTLVVNAFRHISSLFSLLFQHFMPFPDHQRPVNLLFFGPLMPLEEKATAVADGGGHCWHPKKNNTDSLRRFFVTNPHEKASKASAALFEHVPFAYILFCLAKFLVFTLFLLANSTATTTSLVKTW